MAEGYWAVAQTESQRERVALHHLKRQNFETYLPHNQDHAPDPWGAALPRLHLHPHCRPLVFDHGHVGITRLIRDGEPPSCCPDEVIEAVRQREEGGFVKLPTPPKRFAHGQRVRIVRGPFEGHFGLYDGQAPRERCFVLLSLLPAPSSPMPTSR